MKISLILLRAALISAALAGRAYAGYLGPDNVTYDYKTINWFHKILDQESFEVVEGGVKVERYYTTDDTYVSGVVVLGPGGLEEYSVSLDRVDHDIGDNNGGSWYFADRNSYNYHSSGGYSYWRHYQRIGSSVDIYGSEYALNGLGVSYPTSASGTTTSGSGWIAVTEDAPDPIVGSITYFDDHGPDDYQIEYATTGEQNWAMITWSDIPPTVPGSTTPEWADLESEEVVTPYPEIEYPEDP